MKNDDWLVGFIVGVLFGAGFVGTCFALAKLPLPAPPAKSLIETLTPPHSN